MNQTTTTELKAPDQGLTECDSESKTNIKI